MRTRRKAEDSAKYVRVVGDVAYVELTRGRVAVIDAADAGPVGKYLWCWNPDSGGADGYAVTNVYVEGGRTKQILLKLHRFLVDPPEGLEVDHRDLDRLNNRRDNLRICTRAENARNRKPVQAWAGKPVARDFKGVDLRLGKYYVATITAAGRTHNLGSFRSPVRAALAYDRAAKKLHGEFARTNF